MQNPTKGGLCVLQYRDKIRTGKEKERLAKKLQALCKEADVLFCINDDVELAKKIKADAVHLGQKDMPCEWARAILGEDVIIGVTAKTVEQARAAQLAGANYLGSGAMFLSKTRQNALPMSMERLHEICESVEIPVVAIGGIDISNVSTLQHLPIAGVAVCNGLFAAGDIEATARAFRKIMEE